MMEVSKLFNVPIWDEHIIGMTSDQLYIFEHIALVEKLKTQYLQAFSDRSSMPTEEIFDDPAKLHQFLRSRAEDIKRQNKTGDKNSKVSLLDNAWDLIEKDTKEMTKQNNQ